MLDLPSHAVRTQPCETRWCEPFAAFAAARRRVPAGLVFLDSNDADREAAGARSRWSYLGVEPFEMITARRPDEAPAGLARLASRLDARRAPVMAPAGAPPFLGGAIGLIGYEAGLALHGLRSRHPDPQTPALRIGLYDRLIAFDRVERRCWIIAPAAAARAALEALIEDGRGAGADAQTDPPDLDWRASTTPGRHRAAVAEIVAAIEAGALFQANFTAACSAVRPEGLDLTALYRRLRARTQAPFSAWVDLGRQAGVACALLSASPERFLHVDAQGRVETRPIKGTAARGADPAADRVAAAALAASDKDRAENLMIVDLMRNDLARVARVGSVRVPRLCEVETFATVHHLVSSVTAELAPGRTALDLLAACLPGGSITGAPKHAAMRMIDRIEDRARGAYCGSVVRIGFDGAMDSSIVIRSLVAGPRMLRADAGGGITAASDAQAEVDEARLKLAALIAP